MVFGSSFIRENVHQVGSILFETNFIITQLAIRLTKAADGGRNVEVSRIASCVIMKFVSSSIIVKNILYC